MTGMFGPLQQRNRLDTSNISHCAPTFLCVLLHFVQLRRTLAACKKKKMKGQRRALGKSTALATPRFPGPFQHGSHSP